MEDTEKEYRKKRKVMSIISALVLVAFFTVATVLLWKPLTSTFSKPQQFRSWVNKHGVMGRFAFVGMVFLQVIFAVIPGELMEVGAGYAFGTIEGLILCLIGIAIGSVVIFLFTKRLGIRMVETFISREKIQSLRFIKDSRNLNLITFIVFFIPGTPKDLITYFIGLTPMKLGTFLILSSIARIPSIITSTIAGNALEAQSYKTAVIVYVVTGIISIIGIAVYNRISKNNPDGK